MKAIVIEGPSGVGKSLVAFALAKHLQSSIITADSVQLYRGFDIGANKPSAEMQREVSYRMLGQYDPKEFVAINPLTVWKYRNDALAAMREEWAKGRIPVLEGGSHFYIKCLLYGKEDAGTASIPPSLREYAKSLIDPHRSDWEKCIAHVAACIPTLSFPAQKNDFYRLEKAIILHQMGKVPGRELFAPSPLFDARVFYLDMEDSSLVRSVALRCEKLIASGLVEETINLILSGNFNIKEADVKLPEHSVGYTETFAYIKELMKLIGRRKLSDEELVDTFYRYLDNVLISTKRCIRDQRKAFRLTSDQVVYIPLVLDSYSELPLVPLLSRILSLSSAAKSTYMQSTGIDFSVFHARLELEKRVKWSFYSRDGIHPANALTSIYRHMKLLQLHRDSLTHLGL